MNENTLALLTDEEREEYKGMVYDPYTNSPRHEEWDIEELLKAQARKQLAADILVEMSINRDIDNKVAAEVKAEDEIILGMVKVYFEDNDILAVQVVDDLREFLEARLREGE